jgi:hypothetical protein
MEVDLQGRLKAFSLSDIIQLLSFSGQTGTLTLTQGWNSRSMTFEKGRITYITAATKLPNVGELLVKAGKITAQQLAYAIEGQEMTGKTIGTVLVEKQWAQPPDLARCHEQQLEETIYSLFLWRGCRFTMESGVVNKEFGLPVDLATERLILEGTRRVDEWISISPVVPSVRMIFRQVSEAKAEKCSAQERRVFQEVDGTRDVVAIAKAAGLTQFATAKALNALVEAKALRAVAPDKVKIVELFDYLVESMYVKLGMYGYARVAHEFEAELNRFAEDNALKTRMRGGKVALSDLDLHVETTALIDLYKLFIAIEANKFSKMFDPEIVHGLVEGLYLHVNPEFQNMLRMYEFYEIEGLLKATGYD